MVKLDKKDIGKMIEQIDGIIESAKKLEQQYAGELAAVHPMLKKSAQNLFHYLALRHHDIKKLQVKLGHIGVSILGRSENHVMESLLTVRNIPSISDRAARTSDRGKGTFDE